MRVYPKIWIQALGVFTIFLFTFFVFPGITFSPQSAITQAGAWSLILYNTIFNFFDTTGRYLPGLVKLFTPKTVPILTLSRIIFVATFLLIATVQGVFFGSIYFKIVNMIIFAITNGYGSTLHMMYGPEPVRDKDKPVAGFTMSCHLLAGIFIGSLIADFGFEKIL